MNKLKLSLGEKRGLIDMRVYENRTDELLPCLDDMLNRNHIRFSDIGLVIVVNGPGSFTSVRIGVLLANNLKRFYDIPLGEVRYHEDMDLESIFKNSDDYKIGSYIKPFYGKEPNITISKNII